MSHSIMPAVIPACHEIANANDEQGHFVKDLVLIVSIDMHNLQIVINHHK